MEYKFKAWQPFQGYQTIAIEDDFDAIMWGLEHQVDIFTQENELVYSPNDDEESNFERLEKYGVRCNDSENGRKWERIPMQNLEDCVREIKFRAWNKAKKFMDTAWCIDWEHGQVCHRSHNASDLQDCVLMQYTGLKDCEGVEIFESDLIKDFLNEKTYQVFWDNYGMFIFTELNSTTGGLDYYELEEEASMDCLMVIGNIYENAKLLDK